jgi:hypothetical protein
MKKDVEIMTWVLGGIAVVLFLEIVFFALVLFGYQGCV